MQLKPQITFRNMPPSDAIETNVHEQIEKLDQFYDRITSCRVVIEAPHRHHHKGNLYQVRIDLTLPGKEFAINRSSSEHHAHEDLYVAIRDAFSIAKRELKEYAQRQRRDIKVHEVPPHGRISALFLDEGYGFIAASDGQEVYFHQNSLLDVDFSQLEVGQEVRFVEENGNQGPQATTVRVIGKHHLSG